MPLAYVALGSNLVSKHGDPEQTLTLACSRLETLGRVVARSSLYETEPVGFWEQNSFFNAAIVLETELAPLALLCGLLAVERELGRDRSQSVANGPRTLDLDLLMVEDCIFASEDLSLPHPALAQRRFVLAPLAEIAPHLRHPELHRTIEELLAQLPDVGENRVAAVRRLPPRSGWPL